MLAILFLIASRAHYTIDIIISVYVCTQLFWTYHTLCLEPNMFQAIKNNGLVESLNEINIMIISNEDLPVNPVPNKNRQQSNRNRNYYARNNQNLISYFFWWPLFVYFEVEHEIPNIE